MLFGCLGLALQVRQRSPTAATSSWARRPPSGACANLSAQLSNQDRRLGSWSEPKAIWRQAGVTPTHAPSLPPSRASERAVCSRCARILSLVDLQESSWPWPSSPSIIAAAIVANIPEDSKARASRTQSASAIVTGALSGDAQTRSTRRPSREHATVLAEMLLLLLLLLLLCPSEPLLRDPGATHRGQPIRSAGVSVELHSPAGDALPGCVPSTRRRRSCSPSAWSSAAALDLSESIRTGIIGKLTSCRFIVVRRGACKLSPRRCWKKQQKRAEDPW